MRCEKSVAFHLRSSGNKYKYRASATLLQDWAHGTKWLLLLRGPGIGMSSLGLMIFSVCLFIYCGKSLASWQFPQTSWWHSQSLSTFSTCSKELARFASLQPAWAAHWRASCSQIITPGQCKGMKNFTAGFFFFFLLSSQNVHTLSGQHSDCNATTEFHLWISRGQRDGLWGQGVHFSYQLRAVINSWFTTCIRTRFSKGHFMWA